MLLPTAHHTTKCMLVPACEPPLLVINHRCTYTYTTLHLLHLRLVTPPGTRPSRRQRRRVRCYRRRVAAATAAAALPASAGPAPRPPRRRRPDAGHGCAGGAGGRVAGGRDGVRASGAGGRGPMQGLGAVGVGERGGRHVRRASGGLCPVIRPPRSDGGCGGCPCTLRPSPTLPALAASDASSSGRWAVRGGHLLFEVRSARTACGLPQQTPHMGNGASRDVGRGGGGSSAA